MRPMMKRNQIISELVGFTPLPSWARDVMLPFDRFHWRCNACGKNHDGDRKLIMLLRDRSVSLKQFMDDGGMLYHFRFLCEDCFDAFKVRFADRLVVERLQGDI